jgi:hypothetical protein
MLKQFLLALVQSASPYTFHQRDYLPVDPDLAFPSGPHQDVVD